MNIIIEHRQGNLVRPFLAGHGEDSRGPGQSEKRNAHPEEIKAHRDAEEEALPMIEECLWRRLLDPVGNNVYRLSFHADEPMPVRSLTGVPSGICPSLDENFLLNRGIPEPSHY